MGGNADTKYAVDDLFLAKILAAEDRGGLGIHHDGALQGAVLRVGSYRPCAVRFHRGDNEHRGREGKLLGHGDEAVQRGVGMWGAWHLRHHHAVMLRVLWWHGWVERFACCQLGGSAGGPILPGDGGA